MYYKVGLPENTPEGKLKPEHLEEGKKYDIVEPLFENPDDMIVMDEEKFRPSYPFDKDGNPDLKFWSEFNEVAIRVKYAKKKAKIDNIDIDLEQALMPEVLGSKKEFVSQTFRKHFGVRTMHDAAMSVKADIPTDVPVALLKTLLNMGATPKEMFKSKFDTKHFTKTIVFINSLLGEMIYQVSPFAFYKKWQYRRPRPAEAAGMWARGEAGDLGQMNSTIAEFVNKEAVLKNQNSFAVYPHPHHPSYPAMHGSAAGIACIFPAVMNLDDEMMDEVRRTAANLALFRDYAGVHYRSDSCFGLWLGEEIAEERLPLIIERAAKIHGFDMVQSKEEIRETIKSSRNDWLKGIIG